MFKTYLHQFKRHVYTIFAIKQLKKYKKRKRGEKKKDKNGWKYRNGKMNSTEMLQRILPSSVQVQSNLNLDLYVCVCVRNLANSVATIPFLGIFSQILAHFGNIFWE